MQAPKTTSGSERPESPVSNTKGELPDEEPTLDFGDLIDTFDSREEAISFIERQIADRNQVLTETKAALLMNTPMSNGSRSMF